MAEGAAVKVADIPADDVLTLTAALARAFRTENCEPACHCCGKDIQIGRKFKLAFIPSKEPLSLFSDGHDVMLCYHCTPAKLAIAREKERVARMRRAGHGFTREHKPC